uniref:Uncharacterized protein n=1 Tax=Ascaris lumbricoides TaxID=6252 RepID=A0A0M3I6R2_ASCLU
MHKVAKNERCGQVVTRTICLLSRKRVAALCFQRLVLPLFHVKQRLLGFTFLPLFLLAFFSL